MLPILPVDSGVIRCICNYDHDDNFTIQCERCNAWQHAGCVGIANEASVPENYVCPECSDTVTPMAREEARDRQRLILKQRAQLGKHPAPPRAAAHDEHDEPRRRGRKRRSDSDSVEPPEQIIVANPEAYYIPSPRLLWSAGADEWRRASAATLKELPLAPRDAKPVPLHVVRRLRDAKRYNLGVDTLGLATPASVPANRFVCDVTGEVLLRTEYAREPHNQHARLGCPKPGIVFVPGLPLAIDSRRRGSQALFVRRGPQPNVRLVPCRTSKGDLRVLLYTRTALHPGDELLLGWHWPAAHPIHSAHPESPLLSTMFWLLGLSHAECAPSAQEDGDEDWEIVNAYVPPARPVSHAQQLRETFVKRPRVEKRTEPLEVPALRVWVTPPQEPVVQKKKKLSLADYIKKRA